ncbi:MAG: hypothetical protein P3T54_07760 [Dehalogenimonas sp.]|uniref:Integral membrane protein n=1 Tax=Candidatus Dehalogenimonas loeffleri TaxID=3127115 RepID=A0ABZ2J3R9_9CHLR|nr:hypothetical protein [Dehalogenimonas sp.]
MHWTGKSILFTVTNIFFIGWLALILEMLLRVLRGEDPLALLGILVADIAFLGVGIALAVLNQSYPVGAANRALPFIAIIGLTIVAVMDVSDFTLWLGVALSVALIVTVLTASFMTLARR